MNVKLETLWQSRAILLKKCVNAINKVRRTTKATEHKSQTKVFQAQSINQDDIDGRLRTVTLLFTSACLINDVNVKLDCYRCCHITLTIRWIIEWNFRLIMEKCLTNVSDNHQCRVLKCKNVFDWKNNDKRQHFLKVAEGSFLTSLTSIKSTTVNSTSKAGYHTFVTTPLLTLRTTDPEKNTSRFLSKDVEKNKVIINFYMHELTYLNFMRGKCRSQEWK